MIYVVRFSRSVAKDIRRIPSATVDRIQKVFDALAQNPFPSGAEPISGYEHHFRVRVGNYRIIYAVSSDIRIVLIIKIGHRKDVYRRMK